MGKGLCVVITGAAGTGKSAVIDHLLDVIPNSVRLITTTTRAPRHYERDGVDYNFVSTEHFERMIERGELVEWQDNYGNYYGSESAVLESLLQNYAVVFVGLDTRGAKMYRKVVPEVVSIALFVPPEQIPGRILGRGPIDSVELEKRLESITEEQNEIGIFDFVVENVDGGFETNTIPQAIKYVQNSMVKRKA